MKLVIPIEIVQHYNPAYSSEKELLEKMYKKYTLNEMSEVLGYSCHLIRKRMIFHKIKRRSQKRLPPGRDYQARLLKIPEEKLGNMYARDIFKKIGCNTFYGYSLLRRHQIKYKEGNRNHHGESKIFLRFSKIPKENLKDMTQKEIAEKSKCTVQHVNNLLKKVDMKCKSNRLKKGEKHARAETH